MIVHYFVFFFKHLIRPHPLPAVVLPSYCVSVLRPVLNKGCMSEHVNQETPVCTEKKIWGIVHPPPILFTHSPHCFCGKKDKSSLGFTKLGFKVIFGSHIRVNKGRKARRIKEVYRKCFKMDIQYVLSPPTHTYTHNHILTLAYIKPYHYLNWNSYNYIQLFNWTDHFSFRLQLTYKLKNAETTSLEKKKKQNSKLLLKHWSFYLISTWLAQNNLGN